MLTIQDRMLDRLQVICETDYAETQMLFIRDEAAFYREAAQMLMAEAEQIEAATA